MGTRSELYPMMRVLLVDSDQNTCELLKEHLEREGMRVQLAHDGKTGLKHGLSREHDFVVLDLTLPDLTGLEVTRQLRASSTTVGILTLSNRNEEVEKIVGLELGADDCLAKPFNPRELVARIRAISWRRTPWLAPNSVLAPECLEVGDLSLDGGSRTCLRSTEPIDLTTAEFDLLSVFLRCSGRAIHRRDLLKRVLEREYSPFDRTIDVHVCNLQRKLGPLLGGAKRIRAVRRVGYMYVHSSASQPLAG